MKMRKKFGLISTLVLGLMLQIVVTEKASGAYLDGAEGIMTGVLPSFWQYIENDSMFYSAHTHADIKMYEFADTFRFVHVTDTDVFGGYWAQQLMATFLRKEYESDIVLKKRRRRVR